MKMRIILIYLIFISSFALGQNKGEVFATNSSQSEGGIELKWLYQNVYHPDGFKVYRKESGSNWELISKEPIKPISKLPSGHKLNDEEKGLFEALKSISYEEFKENIVRAFVLIKAIYSNELADYVGIYYHDKTAKLGTKYEYKITLNNEDEIAVSKEILCGPYQIPSPPEEIIIDRRKKYITMNWKPDIYRYYGVDIYRKTYDGDEYELMNTSGSRAIQLKHAKAYNENSIFFVDTSIVYDANYIYKYVAVDYFGQKSEMSKEYSAPMKDFIFPQMPFNFKLTPSSSKEMVQLEWEAIDEADLAGYHIYTSDDPDAEFKRITTELVPKAQHNYVHENVVVGGHYYAVSTVDIAGNETSSGMMFTELKDGTPPNAPTGLTSVAESGTITLNWESNTEGDLKGYFVQKSLNDDNNADNSFINVNSTPLSETTYTEKLSTNIKNKFVYQIVAMDTSFNRSKPSVNSLAQMPDVIAPKTPVLSNVQIVDETIKVKWLANADGDLKGYNLYRGIEGDSITFKKVNINLIPKTIVEYIDRNIEEGVRYFYQIEAIDQSDNKSSSSLPFKIRTPKAKIELEIEIQKSNYNKKNKQITIQWYAPESVAMKGYVVYMADESGIMKPVSGLSEYTEYKTKKDLTETSAEFEVRGYTQEGIMIKTDRISINSNK